MAESLGYIQALQDAIRKAHGCESKHSGSVPIEEVFQGKTIWMGNVEVFQLIGHAEASLCYAWGHAAKDTGKEVHIVTALAVPPVDSPRRAVQAAILAESKRK
jgi:hypothetical protein